MSKEEVIENLDTPVDTPEVVDEAPAREVEPRLALEPKNGKNSIRNLIKASVDKVNKEEDDPVPMTSKERRAAAPPVTEKQPEETPVVVSQEIPEPVKTAEPAKVETPQPSGLAPPAALTKEEKALWDSIPVDMQKAFLRRETDTQKGVEQLKAKYQPIEEALAPIKPMLQQRGLSEAHAVKQLFDWHVALASPNKASQEHAFRALAQSHGFNLSSLMPQQQQYQPQATQETNPQQVDPLKQIEALVEQRLQPVNEQLNNYAAEIQRQKFEAANNELAAFSQDKPLIERPGVKPRMAEILTTAAQFGRPVTLQQAYDEAVWGMSDLRTEILQEQEAKREADFKATQEESQRQSQLAEAERARKEVEAQAETKRKQAEAVEKARRANVSPRSTTPVGTVSGQAPKRSQSVGDTLKNVVKDLRGAA